MKSSSSSSGSSSSAARFHAPGHVASTVGRHLPSSSGSTFAVGAVLPVPAMSAIVRRISKRTITAGSRAAATRIGSTSAAAIRTELPSPLAT
jgi:hypothetical protein